MSLLLKRKAAHPRSKPALKKRHRAHAKLTEIPVRSWAWTPFMEDRRLNGNFDPDGRREVDRAKEARDDNDGGPDA